MLYNIKVVILRDEGSIYALGEEDASLRSA